MNQKKGVNNYASPPQDIIMQLILFTRLKLKINNQVSVIMTICSFFLQYSPQPTNILYSYAQKSDHDSSVFTTFLT